MNSNDRIEQLRVINHFNLDGPYSDNEVRDTDLAILNSMRKFIIQYTEEIKQHYTFIIKYDNDIFSFLAYRIIRNLAAATNNNFDIRILGEIKSPEEKEWFKGIKTIGLHKARRLKKAILITGFNPICNVDCISNFSNIFIEIYNPIERFTPIEIKNAQNFFVKDTDSIYKEIIYYSSPYHYDWDDFYTYPVGSETFSNGATCNPLGFRNIIEKCDTTIPLVFFKLSGTEEDFALYDFIRKSSEEGNIHLYVIQKDKIDFVKTNLSPYLDFRNQLNDINTITKEEAIEIIDSLDSTVERAVYNYKTYKEEDNEDSNQ